VQDGLADLGDGLAGGRARKVNGQVGQAEYFKERVQALLLDELLAVVVRGVVGEDGLDELHDVGDVVEQGNVFDLLLLLLLLLLVVWQTAAAAGRLVSLRLILKVRRRLSTN
jgi:hypothetical protein